MRNLLSARSVGQVLAFGTTLACNGSSWFALQVPDRPYYLYNGAAIYLNYNTTRITVEADSAFVPQLPADAGVAVDSVTSWHAARNHWVIWLSPGLSPGAAFHAAQQLRSTPSVQFGSNAYDVPDLIPVCTLLLNNTLGVKFKSGVTSSQINDLLQQLHTSGQPDRYDSSIWLLRYPIGLREPPLQLANDLYHNPLVEFAEADWVGCISPA